MELISNNIFIRIFEGSDAEALLRLHVRNKEFFQRYSPVRSDDFYTLEAKQRFISDCKIYSDKDERYGFGIFKRDNGELIGNINLTGVLREPNQTCLIGYSLDKEHNGKGYMTEAVSLAVKYAFEVLKLHRIEAGVMPSNIGSIRALEKAGFQKEGTMRKAVKINGQWEDHLLMAIVSDTN